MAKKTVLHLNKGRTWLLHTVGKKRISGSRSLEALVTDQYGDVSGLSLGTPPDEGALSKDVQYGISLHPYPLEIVDYLGHYFLPVEKAA
jgi:hypothetical protein